MPDWFRIVIATGLQKLLALRLAGTPPEDAIVGTAEVWLEAIWNNGCRWDEQLDRERLERAFLVLFRVCDRWLWLLAWHWSAWSQTEDLRENSLFVDFDWNAEIRSRTHRFVIPVLPAPCVFVSQR